MYCLTIQHFSLLSFVRYLYVSLLLVIYMIPDPLSWFYQGLLISFKYQRFFQTFLIQGGSVQLCIIFLYSIFSLILDSRILKLTILVYKIAFSISFAIVFILSISFCCMLYNLVGSPLIFQRQFVSVIYYYLSFYI